MIQNEKRKAEIARVREEAKVLGQKRIALLTVTPDEEDQAEMEMLRDEVRTLKQRRVALPTMA